MKTFIASSLSLSNINSVFKISTAGYRFNPFTAMLNPGRILFNSAMLLKRRANIRDEFNNLIRVDEKDSLGVLGGKIHEPAIRRLMSERIKPGSTVLDIGANIGYHTLLLSRLAGVNGRVYAFEPSGQNFALLEANIRNNRICNATAENIAVSDSNGPTRLYLNDSNHGMNRVYDSLCADLSIEVESVKLDDYLRDRVQRVDFVKIDVEGWEYPALKGMIGNIRKNSRIEIITEYSPASMTEAGVDPVSYLEFLLDNGFDIFLIGDKKTVLQNPSDLFQWTNRIAEIADAFISLVKEKGKPFSPAETPAEFIRFASSRYGYKGEFSMDLFCRGNRATQH